MASSPEPLTAVGNSFRGSANDPEGNMNEILVEIFNKSQHVQKSDSALNQIIKLYKNTELRNFEPPFKNCLRKLLQSEQTIYFKTSCDFVCKFLQHVSKLTKERDTTENTAPQTTRSPVTRSPVTRSRGRQAANKRGAKRKQDVPDDELVAGFLNTSDDDSILIESPAKKRKSALSNSSFRSPITDHDQLVSSCIDTVDIYMQVADERCRANAVFFICKFLAHVDSVDETIYDALKSTLPKRIRDKKPMIRAQAVLASRTFQEHKLTQDAFLHHFQRDPELVVRKALLQIMDTKVFGFDFLVESTQDGNESMRKAAFQRLGKVSPNLLTQSQLHCVLHNGLNERERQALYSFKTHTLEPWLSSLYDGLNLYKLLEPFDVINHHDDICRLLVMIYERDLDNLQNNGATTKLHHVVESFREQWLNTDGICLPKLDEIDERISTIWLTLVKFCKSYQNQIKSIKIRPLPPSQDNNPDESIERILDSQTNNDEVAELYERLTPDLVNLVDFLRLFVQHYDDALKKQNAQATKVEFIYQQVMNFASTYEIGDELESKTVQEVFGLMLKENLLTGKIENYIPPIIRCLFKLIYHSSSNRMIHYVSEIINNVRSHLEDLIASTQAPINTLSHSRIAPPTAVVTRSAKKVKIVDRRASRSSYDVDQQNLEYTIATKKVELEELKDKLDHYIKEKDFDEAKIFNNKIKDVQHEIDLLHDRRCSIASDVSHMSMVIETGPSEMNKLCSTMIGDTSMSGTQTNDEDKEENVKIFKHHTNELIKCLQMYLGCLQCVKISEVPQTMLNHLMHLTYESLDGWFTNENRVRSLMVLCNGVTALVDKKFAQEPATVALFLAACSDPNSSIETKTVGYKSIVDMLCMHEDLDVPLEKVENFLNIFLRDYGKYDPNNMKKSEYEFLTAIIEGTTKLYYFKKFSSPRIFSHLVLWWYHPKTHSRLKQIIGIFLPMCVNELSNGDNGDFFGEIFVTSIKYLHSYILGPGFSIMYANDMQSLIHFLCNLIPIASHSSVNDWVDSEINSGKKTSADLLKYLKQSKNILASMAPATKGSTTLTRPIQSPVPQ